MKALRWLPAFVLLGCGGAAPPPSSAPAAREIVTSLDKLPPERFGPSIVRRATHAPESTFARWEVRKGGKFPEHRHPNEQTTYVISGRLLFVVAGRRYELGPGDALQIPRDVPHWAEALEDTVEVDFFTPARADWQRGDTSYLTTGAAAANKPAAPSASAAGQSR
ncbi:MAG: cupin domain-containing protein [Minicystis sp.]